MGTLMTVLGQTDHNLEQLLLVENSADTKDSNLEWNSPCGSRRDQLVLATHSFGVDIRERRCMKQE